MSWVVNECEVNNSKNISQEINYKEKTTTIIRKDNTTIEDEIINKMGDIKAR